MSDVLDKIITGKREEVDALASRYSFADLGELAQSATAPRGFTQALRSASQTGYGLIAELKKASPSKGLSAPNLTRHLLLRPTRQAGQAVCRYSQTRRGSEEMIYIWHRHAMRCLSPSCAKIL